MVDKDRRASHLSNNIFYNHDDDDAVTMSSPQIVENVAPICRGGERVIRIRLPRHLTVELSDIFVLDNCARREVHDDYTLVGQRRHIKVQMRRTAPSRVVCRRQDESSVW